MSMQLAIALGFGAEIERLRQQRGVHRAAHQRRQPVRRGAGVDLLDVLGPHAFLGQPAVPHDRQEVLRKRQDDALALHVGGGGDVRRRHDRVGILGDDAADHHRVAAVGDRPDRGVEGRGGDVEGAGHELLHRVGDIADIDGFELDAFAAEEALFDRDEVRPVRRGFRDLPVADLLQRLRLGIGQRRGHHAAKQQDRGETGRASWRFLRSGSLCRLDRLMLACAILAARHNVAARGPFAGSAAKCCNARNEAQNRARRRNDVQAAFDLCLRALRPHAGALHRRGAGRRRRPQLPGRRQPAQHFRPHGRRARIRRRRILIVRIRLALRRRTMSVRRHSGVRLARVPAQLHLHQQEAHQVAEGPRRQAHRRAGLHHDRGDLHPRALERRARHRLLQERMGRGRHQQRQALTAIRPSCRPPRNCRSAPTSPASR